MAFGGWSDALITLIVFMALDYVTGLIVAGIFKKSKKSENGALESRAGFKGLCRKGVALMIVLVAVRLDIVMHTSYIKDAVIIAFIANESISIIENAGLMGIPVPSVIAKAIDVLKEKDGTPESR
nr:MAG TPA: holin [Caudoviricetes sp.]